MTGFAVEKASSVEVIAAWTVPGKTIQAAPIASVVWTSLGSYYLPREVDARLDVVALVSHASVSINVRLWDETAKAAVSGDVVSFTELVPTRKLGSIVRLLGNRVYQVQAAAISANTSGWRFGAFMSATITD